jgi:hypothetical protein
VKKKAVVITIYTDLFLTQAHDFLHRRTKDGSQHIKDQGVRGIVHT